MATYRVPDDTPHRAVVSNLLDIQARLRGDPASLMPARDGRRESDAVVTVPDPEDPARRIESLRRRLAFLEMEIDAYEHAVPAAEPPEHVRLEAPVTELQHAVDERLSRR